MSEHAEMAYGILVCQTMENKGFPVGGVFTPELAVKCFTEKVFPDFIKKTQVAKAMALWYEFFCVPTLESEVGWYKRGLEDMFSSNKLRIVLAGPQFCASLPKKRDHCTISAGWRR